MTVSLPPPEREDIAPGGRIGLLALATDYNSETDLRRMLPADVALFTNRVRNANPVTLENLGAMRDDLARAAADVLPGIGVDVMIYGCTSGTAVIGESEVHALIRSRRPGVACTNPLAAATAALRAVRARTISVLTPYTPAVDAVVAGELEERGFEVLGIDGFGLDEDVAMTEVVPSAIATAAERVLRPGSEALFISCTALRATSVLDQIEARIGLPVIASNQALVWHALRLMGHAATIPGFGRLLELDLTGRRLGQA